MDKPDLYIPEDQLWSSEKSVKLSFHTACQPGRNEDETRIDYLILRIDDKPLCHEGKPFSLIGVLKALNCVEEFIDAAAAHGMLLVDRDERDVTWPFESPSKVQ